MKINMDVYIFIYAYSCLSVCGNITEFTGRSEPIVITYALYTHGHGLYIYIYGCIYLHLYILISICM